MGEKVFELKEVSYFYLKKYLALCEIDLTIYQGEKVAIIGANGTGKTTLLHILDGLIFPEGKVIFFKQELNENAFFNSEFNRNFRKKVGLVFQNPDVQLFCPTVKEDIAFGLLQLNFDEIEVNKRLLKIARDLNIESLLERIPYQLSVGEKRKVAIASVLAIEPQVIILDEPTAGLDPATINQIIDLILQANQQGKTIIIATHDLYLVEAVADIIYIFNQERRIVKAGRPNEILKDNLLLQMHNLKHASR